MTALTVMSSNSRVPGMEATASKIEKLPDNQTLTTGRYIRSVARLLVSKPSKCGAPVPAPALQLNVTDSILIFDLTGTLSSILYFSLQMFVMKVRPRQAALASHHSTQEESSEVQRVSKVKPGKSEPVRGGQAEPWETFLDWRQVTAI